ncbi:Membrane protease subunit, stomatin/prohibitin family, contains C-terminal Zn-ribbon domain [Actinacidiphila guanduensis]|uniref:Membrane protease subunit, stomatin/prohibitin family, contains C-terminal Zn-ribbon domain n=1 Tax=Actinacidiphila guanduensis TaxID=310781 RepID=A0A1H0GAE2_9ACTN|nr:Membrane protease subunit, stomatin/prohibitin family, contains C-terminal Zn-ribbon domain [Actinacidiphila guanduensis]
MGARVGLFDAIRGEFIDIIEWTDSSRDTIVWRFPRHDNEIKMGAKLIVRESQTAVFVNEGQIADVYTPGTYTLQTQNMPILSTLKGWKYGFDSPFKAEVYFVTTRQFTDMKWGTANPVIVRDAEFGMVRLRAFGTFAAKVVDAAALLRELAGTDPQFRTEEVQEYLRQLVVSKLSTALATAGVPMLDLAGQQELLGTRLAGAISQELAPVGISLPKFVIENISLPPEVEQAIDTRSRMGIAGNLDQYTQFQAADAIGDAARNPGGAGEGIGLGVGMAMGQRIAAGLTPQAPAAPAAAPAPAPAPAVATPPPLPQPAQWFVGIGGTQQGPYDAAALAGLAGAGSLTRETLVWKDGMAAWQPAAQVPDLGGLFAAVPPPLPPQA